MSEPLEFQDGQAWLVKTDILAETLYFSYEKGSLAQVFPLSADAVRDIQSMNRRGERPLTLKQEETVASEYVTGGDDAINRFDAEKRKRRRKSKKKVSKKD